MQKEAWSSNLVEGNRMASLSANFKVKRLLACVTTSSNSKASLGEFDGVNQYCSSDEKVMHEDRIAQIGNIKVTIPSNFNAFNGAFRFKVEGGTSYDATIKFIAYGD